MKKVISILCTVILVLSLVPAAVAEWGGSGGGNNAAADDGVNVLASQGQILQYVEPTYYENGEGEPTIGVTLINVLEIEGKYFRDSNNNKTLDPFEDWRLPVEERAADLVSQLSIEQRIGLLGNQMMASPGKTNARDIYNEDGTVNVSSLFSITGTANSLYMMLTNENRTGVTRNTSDAESGAVWNNITNMVAEMDTVMNGIPFVPYYSISNPQRVITAPSSQGIAAAVMGEIKDGDYANGDYSLVEKYADLDRQIWYARGLDGMYGPQIDLITDPRWPRNSGTYTENPDVNAGIAAALVRGYKDGQGVGSVSLTIKHFPGDGASWNGFESHNKYGEWRVYVVEDSLEKYHLPGFQAAIDAGLTGIMPSYSRPSAVLNAPQHYRGVELEVEEVANAYSKTIIGTLLYDLMGFKGYVNDDSGVINGGKQFGMEDLTIPERYAASINAGSDTGADGGARTGENGIDYPMIWEAYNAGLIEEEAFYRATLNRVTTFIAQGEYENPYRDPKAGAELEAALKDEIAEFGKELHRKSVVLMKNHENALPLEKNSGKKVFVASYSANGSNDNLVEQVKAAFEEAGFSIVNRAGDADIAFLNVAPGGIRQGMNYIALLDLVEDEEVDEYKTNVPLTESKTGDTVTVTTLIDADKIAKVAEDVHANGGIVVASLEISNPWILTKLEPYCDALIGSFSTSLDARMDVLTGDFNPTGKLPITMVSCADVIATVETEIDGVIYDVCVSPNDVPGYDKDQYIDPAILANVPGGSYAYYDADGNYYRSGFGLSY